MVRKKACLSLAAVFCVLPALSSIAQPSQFLTVAEQEWLESTSVIRVASDSNYQPYSFVTDDGELSGIWGHLLDLIAFDLEVTFEVVHFDSFDGVLEALAARTVDMTVSIEQTTEREAYLRFTGPVISVQDVLVTVEESDISGMQDLAGRNVGVVSGYAVADRLSRSFPTINQVPVGSEGDGLSRLALGQLDALVADMGVINWSRRQRGVEGLRVVDGVSLSQSVHRFGIRSDWPELQSILDKAVERIPETEIQSIIDDWFPSMAVNRTVMRRFQYALVIGVLLISGFMVWSFMLRRQVESRTQRLRAEFAQRQIVEKSNEMLASAIDEASEIILIVDRDRKLQYASRSLEELSGVSADSQIGDSIYKVLEPLQAESLQPMWHAVAETGRWRGVLRGNFRNAGSIPLETRANRLDQTEGEGDIVLCMRDRSVEETMEDEIQKTERLKSLGTLAAGIAHDFNNLLTPILVNAELAAHGDSDPEVNKHLGDIEKAALQARELTAKVVSFARESSDELAVVNLATVVRDSVSLVRSSLPANVAIHETLQAQKIPVLCQESEIQSVLLNLFANGSQAMQPAGGELTVRLDTFRSAEKIESARIVVTDTGCGMEEEIAARAFEPYFTTKPAGQGTGLGLALARNILELHGGGIEIQSRPGYGTSVTLWLPSSQMDEISIKEDMNSDMPGNADTVQRVLLIDDDQLVLNVQTRALEYLGYSVDPHNCCSAGLAALERDPDAYVVVVTDNTMPDGSGAVVVKAAKAVRPGLPIIVLTGDPSRVESKDCLVYRKPIKIKELSDAIELAVRDVEQQA